MNEELENVNNDLHIPGEAPDTGAEATDAEAPQSAEVSESENGGGEDGAVDYARLVREDVATLVKEFPELSGLRDITELSDPLRYAALRDLGLTPAEAYLATSRRRRADNRSHLYATRTVSASHGGSMSESELAAAREIFVGIPDSQIRSLYKRVTN